MRYIKVIFFFNDTATTEIYTLSLHDAFRSDKAVADTWNNFWKDGKADGIGSNLSRKIRANTIRSEERFSRNAETDLVCRLLLEKKKKLLITCSFCKFFHLSNH